MIYKRKRKKSFKKYLFIGHLEFFVGLRMAAEGQTGWLSSFGSFQFNLNMLNISFYLMT